MIEFNTSGIMFLGLGGFSKHSALNSSNASVTLFATDSHPDTNPFLYPMKYAITIIDSKAITVKKCSMIT